MATEGRRVRSLPPARAGKLKRTPSSFGCLLLPVAGPLMRLGGGGDEGDWHRGR